MYLTAVTPTWAPMDGADEHQDGGDDLYPGLDPVGEAAVRPGEEDGEQVGAHRNGRGAADQVDQGRHADETAADPQEDRRANR